jgi:hypothetical protein
MGGSLTAESVEGQGTAFTVELPGSPAATGDPTAVAAPGARPA